MLNIVSLPASSKGRLLRIMLGMALCWLSLGIYWSCNTSRGLIQQSVTPQGRDVLFWDTYTYVYAPPGDMLRMVGYPMLIRAMQRIAGDDWLVPFLIFQTFVISLAFWAIEMIADELFASPFESRWILWFMMVLAGLFYTYTGLVRPDAVFASLFLLALGCGLKKRWLFFVILIGIAGQIRPLLIFFPVAWAVILYYRRSLRNPNAIISLICIIVLTQLPCLRNFINHGAWTPSNVMQGNVQILQNTIKQFGSVPLGIIRCAAGATLCTPWVDFVRVLFGYFEKSYGLQTVTVLGIISYLCLWFLFITYSLKFKRLDLLLLVGIFILPASVAGGGARMRLPIEPVIMMCAIELAQFWYNKHKSTGSLVSSIVS